jgi:hypothetical protein
MRSRLALIFTLLICFGASVYLNEVQDQRAQRDHAKLHDELVQLQAQAKQRHLPGPSTTPNSSPPPAEVAGQGSVNISFYGVRLTVTDPVIDLVYGPVRDGYYPVAGFATQTLLAKYPACKAGAIGELVRYKIGAWHGSQPPIKTIGNYNYYYKGPSFSCVTDKSGRDAVAAAIAALKNQALPTLSLAPNH